MTQRETERLDKLEEKIDNLPDLIIERLDDRYLKKDDAPKRYITRLEAIAYSTAVAFIFTVVGFFFLVKDHLK